MVMAVKKRIGEEEESSKTRLAKGWYVKFSEMSKAAEYAESAGHKRVAQKLKRAASEERKNQ